MIIDTLKNAKLYYGANSKFEKGFDFILKALEENLPVGKYEIDGKELYASVQEYATKAPELAKAEGHRNYIDIQYIIDGTEAMEVEDISKAKLNSEYNPEKDVEFYENAKKANVCVLEKGEYAIFFPHDIHRPAMTYDTEQNIRKIVVKVRV